MGENSRRRADVPAADSGSNCAAVRGALWLIVGYLMAPYQRAVDTADNWTRCLDWRSRPRPMSKMFYP